MNSEFWQRVERVYHEALEREPGQRSAFLDEACASDQTLRREVESLLGYDKPAKVFLEEPAIEVAARLMSKAQASLFIGRQIGSYRIISMLGAGGMGEVYLAEDATLDRKVAIKFLSLGSQTDEQARGRLIREAQAAAKLDHPNVCAIHEVGQHERHSFIVMQYVEGETLAARIKRGPLKLNESVDFAAQAAAALSEAHSHGIIHRDIKPQNVMITRRSQVKVLDFGLAKLEAGEIGLQSQAQTQTLLTQPGVIPGTVPYMSPEQLRGEPLDARTDLFSLGAVLYEMVTGRRTFGAESQAESITAILEHEPPPLASFADAPEELQRIVSKCLEKDRERRYQSAQELASDLTNALRTVDRDNVATRSLAGRPRARGAPRARRLWLLAAAALLLIALAYAALLMLAPTAAVDSLAVLPFAIEDSDPSLEYLGEGIPERIINKLAELQSLRVIASTSSFKYKGSAVDTQAVGNKLRVRAVLSGRVTRRGDSLSISAELMDAKDARHIWGEQYAVPESDLLGLEERISQAISEKLLLRLTGPEKGRLSRQATVNPQAYQLYLKGRAYFSKLTPDSVQKAMEQFQQAIQKDPTYALAYAGLADCYTFTGKSAEAKSAVTDALRLDDSLGEAHASLGFIKWIDWDWKGAEAEYRRGIELNPNSPFAHHWYALLLGQSGRHDEAIREARRAQEIDPVSPDISVASAQAFVLAHRYDEAEQELKKTLDMDPGFPNAFGLLAVVYEGTGRYKEALEKYQQIIEKSPNTPEVRAVMRASMARVYARWGNRVEALKILDETPRFSYVLYMIAQIHAALGDRQRAFEWLDKAYQAHDISLLGIKTDPTFESFHQEPRFVELMRRVGLEP